MRPTKLPAPARPHLLATACVALCLWAAVPAALAADGGPLSGDRIRELIVGNTLIGPYYGRPYDFSYDADGNIYGSTGAGTDSGRWRIRDDDVYCHWWTTLFDGTERCYQWYAEDNGRYRLRNVDAFRRYDLHVWRIRPGMGW